MDLFESLKQMFARKQGVDPNQRRTFSSATSDKSPAQVRKENNGQLTRRSLQTIEFFQDDVSEAIKEAGLGNLARMAQLMAAVRTDGQYKGLIASLVSAVTRQPVKFYTDPDVVQWLAKGHNPLAPESGFDLSLSHATRSSLTQDLEELGYCIGEIKDPGPMLDYVIGTRLDPEFLQYVHETNQWIYTTKGGERLEVIPGGGEFFLITADNTKPWEHGIGPAVGRAWARKVETQMARDQWLRKLAGAARVGTSPISATDEELDDLDAALFAWTGPNTEFALPAGWDLKIVESNGKGYEAYMSTIAECNQDMINAVASQSMTTDGGDGFANSETGLTILSDRVTRISEVLAQGLSYQFLPYLLFKKYGKVIPCLMEFDSTPAVDKSAEARAITDVSNAATAIASAVKTIVESGGTINQPDYREMFRKAGVPMTADPANPLTTLAPVVAPKETEKVLN